MSGDVGADASAYQDLFGDKVGLAGVTRRTLVGTTLKKPTDFADLVDTIDMLNYATLLARFDYSVGDGTGLQLKITKGELVDPIVDVAADLKTQQNREDNLTAGKIKIEIVTVEFPAGAGVFELFIKRTQRFVLIEVADTNAGASTSAVAADFQGQRREGR